MHARATVTVAALLLSMALLSACSVEQRTSQAPSVGAGHAGLLSKEAEFAGLPRLDTIDSARSLLPTQAVLPRTLGPVREMISLTGSTEPTRTGWVLFRFTSGLDLYVAATDDLGDVDVDRLMQEKGAAILPFEDGGKKAFETARINGHTAIVQRGGTQRASNGQRSFVEPAVVWQADGVSYTLIAVEKSAPPVAEMVSLAESIR